MENQPVSSQVTLVSQRSSRGPRGLPENACIQMIFVVVALPALVNWSLKMEDEPGVQSSFTVSSDDRESVSYHRSSGHYSRVALLWELSWDPFQRAQYKDTRCYLLLWSPVVSVSEATAEAWTLCPASFWGAGEAALRAALETCIAVGFLFYLESY